MSNEDRLAYEAARTTAALFDVSRRGKLEVAGNDVVVFLHNLSSNDVKKLAPSTGCELFFCTATAKAVAYARAYRTAPEGKRERVWLDVGEGQGEKLFRHLDHFIIGEDVTLTDRSEALAQFHLVGPQAMAIAESASGQSLSLPDGPHSFLDLSGDVLLMVRRSTLLGLPGLDLLCPSERVSEVRQRLLAAGASSGGREAYDTLRIEGGMPEYGQDLDETTFAPEVGRTDAISYQKGCYLGQEPIVMARDRGVVQRTLIGLLVGSEAASSGGLLYREGKEVGRVTSRAYSPRLETWIALAYARRGSQTPGMQLEMRSAEASRSVTVSKLPFA